MKKDPLQSDPPQDINIFRVLNNKAAVNPLLPEGKYCSATEVLSALRDLISTARQASSTGCDPFFPKEVVDQLSVVMVPIKKQGTFSSQPSLIDPDDEEGDEDAIEKLVNKHSVVSSVVNACKGKKIKTIQDFLEHLKAAKAPPLARSWIKHLGPNKVEIIRDSKPTLVIPASSELPKFLPSDNMLGIVAKPSGGFDDERHQGTMMVIGVPSGQEVIIPLGTQLLVSCTNDKFRQEILLAQATHCHLKLDLTVPKVPLTTKLRSLECGLLGLKLVKTEQSARSLPDFQQLALDFGKPI